MVFKKIAMETEQFSEDNFNDLKAIIEGECRDNDTPLLDLINIEQKLIEGSLSNEIIGEGSMNEGLGLEKKRSKKFRIQRNKIYSFVL